MEVYILIIHDFHRLNSLERTGYFSNLPADTINNELLSESKWNIIT